MFSGFLLIPQIAQAPSRRRTARGVRDGRRAAAGAQRGRSARGGPVSRAAGRPIGFRATLSSGLLNVAAFGLLACCTTRWWHLALGGLLLGAGVASLRLDGQPHRRAVGSHEVGIATGSTP
jgi:hypothetical protein